MEKIMSNTLSSYYGEYPSEYDLKFIHYNIDIEEDNLEEYKKLEIDLKNIYDFDSKAFLVYFSDVDNYLKFTKNINTDYSNKIYLRIRTPEEYEKLTSQTNIKLIVDINDIEKLNIKDYDLVIQIDTVSELPISKLTELSKDYKIKEILLGQIPYLDEEYSYLYDVMSKMYNIPANNKLELEKINKVTNDIYSVDDYIKILNKFNSIIELLNIENNVDGIYKIFDYIASSVSYADDGVLHTNITNQNLIGPVFNNKGVCEGYSKYFQQLLSLIGVLSIVVQGGLRKEDGGHIWNQVFVDGKWYNADVTAASYAKRNNEEINTCLVKDQNLKYKTKSSISYECNEDYKIEVKLKNTCIK